MTAPMVAPAMVRNTLAGPAVFGENGQVVEWAGAGDPMGGDLQPVPEVVLNNVQFHRMVARGIFVVEGDTSVIDGAVALHKRDWEMRLEAQRTASQRALDMTPNNDSVVKTCIGPSGKDPNGLCGADVPIRQSKLADTPPLCPPHSGLKDKFIAREGERLIDGKPEIIWDRARMTAPQQEAF